jgi:hypothetical protein
LILDHHWYHMCLVKHPQLVSKACAFSNSPLLVLKLTSFIKSWMLPYIFQGALPLSSFHPLMLVYSSVLWLNQNFWHENGQCSRGPWLALFLALCLGGFLSLTALSLSDPGKIPSGVSLYPRMLLTLVAPSSHFDKLTFNPEFQSLKRFSNYSSIKNYFLSGERCHQM